MNVKEENNVIKLKKDVVKNIAIVFLTVMLLLTFFSNSIMNKSLPEVATQYVQSGTITEKIRGTGIVEADDPYSVMVTDTRVIDSVAVKVGDEVTKDQILFYLQDSESAELEEAQKALEDLILKYTTGALTGEMTDSAYYNATTGKVLGMNTYEAQIEAAKTRVKNAQDTVDSLDRQSALLEGTVTSTSDAEINQAKLDLEKAQITLTNAEAKYNSIKAVIDGGDADLNLAKEKNNLAQQMILTAESERWSKLETLSKLIKVKDPTADANIFNYYDDGSLRSIKDETLLETWISGHSFPEIEDYKEAVNGVKTAKDNGEAVANAYKAEQDKATDRLAKNQASLVDAEKEVSEAKKKVDELTVWISSLTNAKSDAAAADDLSKKQLAADIAVKKIDAANELSKAKEAQAQLLTDISKTLDLANQNSIIRDQQEKVAKLKEKASGAVVTSPVDGTILSIAKKAGESTSASDALATIQVAGKAMTMNFSVTAEQAKKVSIGDTASLQNAWYYSDDIRIVLTKIANDPNNPGKNKLLMFNVEGAVSNGESLNVSLGQNPREYSMVVPNSAIREDNHGKFIFTIEEKSTPFGNRYKAKRADVEVITSDDSNTAIKADIDSWSYVITTSNKPIESGQQVRLSDR